MVLSITLIPCISLKHVAAFLGLSFLVASFAMPQLSSHAEAQVGVYFGSWAMYSLDYTWRSSNASEPASSFDVLWDSVDWVNLTVSDVSGTTVTMTYQEHFTNGTIVKGKLYGNLNDLSGNLTTLGWGFLFPAKLVQGSTFGSSYLGGNPLTVNQTMTRNVAGSDRSINLCQGHLTISTFLPISLQGDGVAHPQFTLLVWFLDFSYYWDKETGIGTEAYFNWTVGGTPTRSHIWHWKLEQTNLWAPPSAGLDVTLYAGVAVLALVVISAVYFFVIRKKPKPVIVAPPEKAG